MKFILKWVLSLIKPHVNKNIVDEIPANRRKTLASLTYYQNIYIRIKDWQFSIEFYVVTKCCNLVKNKVGAAYKAPTTVQRGPVVSSHQFNRVTTSGSSYKVTLFLSPSFSTNVILRQNEDGGPFSFSLPWWVLLLQFMLFLNKIKLIFWNLDFGLVWILFNCNSIHLIILLNFTFNWNLHYIKK